MAGRLLNLRLWMVGLRLQAGPWSGAMVIPSAHVEDNR